MKLQKRVGLAVLCLSMVLSVILIGGCKDKNAPNLTDFFSQEQIDDWGKENKDKELKYTMNGGYFLCFQGKYYPIEFNDGYIVWLEEPPLELLFVTMNELFTDAALRKRCAYLGVTEHAILFQPDCQHSGYILDGKRPEYGSVLYVNESDMRRIELEWGASGSFTVDQPLVATSYRGGTPETPLVAGRIVLTGENGEFLEKFNTFRKILTYAKESGIPFDARTEYSGLTYPSSVMTIVDDHFWQDEDPGSGGWMKAYTMEIKSYYCIQISYGDGVHEDLHCMLFTSDRAKEETYEKVRFDHENPSSWAYFKDPIWDENGELVSCYVYDFYAGDQGETVNKFFDSVAELQVFLQNQKLVNYEAKTALSYFVSGQSGMEFDPVFDFQNLYGVLRLEAVWNPYRVVNLHGGDTAKEAIVRNDDGLVLQPAMRPGYEFEGWYASSDFTGQPVTVLHYGDTYQDLYAKFRKVDFYTLTFQELDGKITESIQYVYGESFQLPKLTKAFHIFKGWCVDAACKTEPITEINAEFYGSYHLYPCFEARTYTITLHYGDKTKDVQVAYGAMYATPLGVDNGFIGYFDENGVQYTDEKGNSLAPFTDGADIQLFARYKGG